MAEDPSPTMFGMLRENTMNGKPRLDVSDRQVFPGIAGLSKICFVLTRIEKTLQCFGVDLEQVWHRTQVSRYRLPLARRLHVL